MPFDTRPLPASLDGPTCQVHMTAAQAALIRRGMQFYAEKAMGLSDDEREEAQAIADMAQEIDPDVINGWSL